MALELRSSAYTGGLDLFHEFGNRTWSLTGHIAGSRIAGDSEVIENAREAIRRAGLEVRMHPIRGGTDGSRLSFMGLPTPNIFAGEHNFHSRYEWISTSDMHKAVEIIIELCRVWDEKSPHA
jgi:tripeptide aminopeptidase